MKHLLILIFLEILLGCSGTDCVKIPTIFKSYDEAKMVVENANFKFKDKINTIRSSWIRNAEFYSCDNKIGFFILTTDNRKYIHKAVPIEIWNGFKNAQSFGNYYNRFIKYHYPLSIKR